MKITIVGCGAIGGVISGGIIEHNPVVVSKNNEILNAIKKNGLKVKLPDGKESITWPEIFSSIEKTKMRFDVVFVCTKANSVFDVVTDFVGFLTERGFFVTFQNGIVEGKLKDVLPQGKLVGAIVGFGATMHAPGVVEMTSKGEIVIGELDGKVTERVQVLKSILNNVIETRITTNIWGAKYSKLLINACITTMGAVSGLTLGKMLSYPQFRAIFRRILYEGVEVAKRKGIKLEKISGVSIHKLAASQREVENKLCLSKYYKDFIIKIIGRKYRNLKSSSLQSLERGRKTEVDFINGIIVKYGREVGFATPVNERIVSIVHEIEGGKRDISIENLRELISL